MSFTDQEIICKECGTAFMWSGGEQEFFAEKGLTNTPSRCPICRKKKDVKHSFQASFDIACADCGKKSQSPFKPADPQNVLCQECFDKKNNNIIQNNAAAQLADASAAESGY